MQWSLSSLLRTLVWVAIGLSVIAIGLGRYAPRRLPEHHAAAVRYHGVNMHCSPDRDPQPCFLDRETGQILHLEFPPRDTLDYAVCSPWRDEHGQFQAVCRWMGRGGKGFDYLPLEFGVARFTLPEGRLIDRIKLDQVPNGEPCWMPGGVARIIFASGDGRLYRYRFDDLGSGSLGEAPELAQPQQVTWHTAPPGKGMVYVRDLIWPGEAKLGGRLIASLCYAVECGGKPTLQGPELWWLQLGEDQTSIEAAGRLTAPGIEHRSGGEDEVEERLPNLGTTAEGDLPLAYLRRASLQGRWELHVASVAIDPATGVPRVRPGNSRRIGGGFVSSAPTFSVDGRWVYGIRGQEPGRPQLTLRRFSVTATLMAQTEEVLSSPWSPRIEPRPLFGFADLVLFPPNRLVEMGAGRHPGE